MINPYSGKDFFSFFSLLFERLFHFSTPLASDEIQLLVLMGVGIATSLVGTFLVLKQMTMLANSLSHTLLLGIVVAYLITGSSLVNTLGFTPLLIASLVTGLLTALLTQFLTQVAKLQEDASIGLVFTTLFALGIVLVTIFTRNSHIGTELIMGNVDALHIDDLKLIYGVALCDLLCIGLLFKEFKITSFDGGLARSLGISTQFFNYLLMILVAATAVAAFRAVGVLLVLAFLVGPPLIARQMTHHLGRLIGVAIGIGAGCSLIGVALSRHLLTVYQMPLSTGGIVVTIIGIVYLGIILIKRISKRRLIKKCGSVNIVNN